MKSWPLMVLTVFALGAMVGCASDDGYDDYDPSGYDDSFQTVAYDYTPAPHGGGEFWKTMGSRLDSNGQHLSNMYYSMKYRFLNANSNYYPYEDFCDGSFGRDMTTLSKTIDTYFFNYDWDNPYVD